MNPVRWMLAVASILATLWLGWTVRLLVDQALAPHVLSRPLAWMAAAVLAAGWLALVPGRLAPSHQRSFARMGLWTGGVIALVALLGTPRAEAPWAASALALAGVLSWWLWRRQWRTNALA